MFAKLVARLFGTRTLTPNCNALRFRPRVEGLEDRLSHERHLRDFGDLLPALLRLNRVEQIAIVMEGACG